MKLHNVIFAASLSACAFSTLGCDEGFDAQFEGEFREARREVQSAPPRDWTGSMWAPCDLTDVEQPDWWGCDGAPGEGLACARPLGDEPLSICVPQLEDNDDCLAAWDWGQGPLKIVGGAYCVVSCEQTSDCRPLQECSAYGMCAWTEF